MFPSNPIEAPGYNGGNTTGFPSPAADSIVGPIDLADALDLRRPSRYAVRVVGQALTPRGVFEGDVLIVDAARTPKHGDVAIIMTDGEVLLAQLAWRQGQWLVKPGAEEEPERALPADAEVWGVVRSLVRLEV